MTDDRTVNIDRQTLLAIRKAVAEELAHRSRVDAETHALHHEYLKNLLECQRRRREIATKVVTQVLGLGAAIGLGFIGKAVWDAVVAAARVVK